MSGDLTLCIASIDFANGSASHDGDRSVLLLDLPDLPAPAGARAPNTIRIAIEQARGAAQLLDGRGDVRWSGELRLEELYCGLRPSPKLRTLIGDNASPADEGAGSMVPLFLFLSDAAGRTTACYSQVRFAPEDALFIRTTSVALEDVPCSERHLATFLAAWRAHQQHALFLNNHQRYYTKVLADSEVEVKFSLPADADIWDLTADVYARIRGGGLPGFMVEYRDEFQQWDFPTRLYRITDPGQEGYISFIPSPDGRVRVKQKRFAADARIRKESLSDHQRLPGTTEEHIRSLVGTAYEKLPALRRARYDVNFESLATGHVYGIFFDRVAVVGAPHVTLAQCEVEYLRSRRIAPAPVDEMLAEHDAVVRWTKSFLAARGLPASESYYSKLSFLCDAVADGRVTGDPSAGVLD